MPLRRGESDPSRRSLLFSIDYHVVLNTAHLDTQHVLPYIYMNAHIRTYNSTKITDKENVTKLILSKSDTYKYVLRGYYHILT